MSQKREKAIRKVAKRIAKAIKCPMAYAVKLVRAANKNNRVCK